MRAHPPLRIVPLNAGAHNQPAVQEVTNMADGNGAKTAVIDTGPPPADLLPAARGPQVYRLGDLLDEWDTFSEEQYEARQSGKPLGIRTGLDGVDEKIGYFFRPGLHSLQGPSNLGKTALALQIAATCGFPALFVSAEMSCLELMRRITTRVTGTFLGKYVRGEVAPEQAKADIRRAIATCPELAIMDCTTGGYAPAVAAPGTNLVNIYDAARTLKGDSPHLFIVIDALHSWASMNPAEAKEYEYLNAAMGSLSSLAKALDCPILLITQRNRQNVVDGGQNAGAGTRFIEYLSESVIELDPEEWEDPKKRIPKRDLNGETIMRLVLTKNRNGMCGGRPVSLAFRGDIQRFREV